MPRVGQTAERTRLIRPEYVRLFTEISGDRNPLHYDDLAAKKSRFGEIVVQGGVTSSILNVVVAEDLPGPGTVFLQVDWKFTAPVRPGDTITGRRDSRGPRGQADHQARHPRDATGRRRRARGHGGLLHDGDLTRSLRCRARSRRER
ncbi:MAG TPA: MaoC/PaaZ C-terminal domain-containing protein [Vicinamibacteria bacterium]|nr:MaoC/PaaZ C-terminal domain-containing protein [Vicinamibacteria bacterium]